jgi:hypothetical protein
MNEPAQTHPLPEELPAALDALTTANWSSELYDVNDKLGRAERIYNAWERHRREVMQVPT